jgi:DNA-binding protein HU-beta
VTKQEVVENVAERCDLSKAAAGRALDAMLDTLTEVMADGEEVSFTGFGKFFSQRRRARDGVNPQDPSQKIRIRAANVPKFRPGVTLREAVSQAPVAARTDGSPVEGGSAASGDGAGAPSSSVASAGSTKTREWRPLGERG